MEAICNEQKYGKRNKNKIYMKLRLHMKFSFRCFTYVNISIDSN